MTAHIEFTPAPVKLDYEFFENLFYPKGWQKTDFYEARKAGATVVAALFAGWNCNEKNCLEFFNELTSAISGNVDMIEWLEKLVNTAREIYNEENKNSVL